MSKNSGFFEGFLVGAIVGVVGGLLFAPQTGEETRDQIRVKAQDYKGSEDAVGSETMIAKTLEAIDKGFDKLSKMVDERQEGAEEGDSFSDPKEKAA